MTTLLFVCTGNLCRSPLMEHLLRAELAQAGVADGEIVVRSAGTLAHDDDPMHRHSAAVLAVRGYDGAEFRTRWLTEKTMTDVDIVIGAAREHRAAAVRLKPSVLNRAFTLAELSRIAATIEASELPAGSAADRLSALVALAATRRTHTLPENPNDDDLADPIGGPIEDFIACAAAIDRLLKPVVDRVVPPV